MREAQSGRREKISAVVYQLRKKHPGNLARTSRSVSRTAESIEPCRKLSKYGCNQIRQVAKAGSEGLRRAVAAQQIVG